MSTSLQRLRRAGAFAKGRPERRFCAYCGQPATTWDHVVPVALGGDSRFENLVPACRRCNGQKGARPIAVFLAERAQQRAALGGKPASGQPFPCPSCREGVYLRHAEGRLWNVRRKGEPRTPHSCDGFKGGYPMGRHDDTKA